MTIGTATSRVIFNCDGVTKVFPVPIQGYLNSDFTVILTAPVSAGGAGATLALNSDYSLVPSGTLQPPAWSLTTLALAAYATGYTLQVFSNPVQTQQTQYVQGQAFPSLAVQTNMDRLTQMVQRLQDEGSRSIGAPDGDVTPLMLLPVAALRVNKALMFDASGNVALGVPNTQTITTGLLAPFLNLQVTAAETAALVTPVNLAYPPGNVLRYGTNTTPGTTDMTAAIQAALNAAGYGNPAAYAPAGTYAYSSDITIPVGVAFLSNPNPLGVMFYGDGPQQTILKAIAGGAFTNGLYVNGGATYKLAGMIRDMQINCNVIAPAGITLSFAQNCQLQNLIVRGSTGRGIYVNNCIMTRLHQCFLSSNGSASFGQIEIDGTLAGSTGGTTTTTLDQVYVSTGNAGCLGGLLLDRAQNTTILGGAYESSDIPLKISSKATSVQGCIGLTILGTDFENPLDHYIEAGYGLTGVYVTNMSVRDCTGYPSGAATVPKAIKLSMVNGAKFDNNHWAQPSSGAIATYWLEGTNPLRTVIDAHPSLYGNAWPYVMSNGSQVFQATPLVQYNQVDSPPKPVPQQLAATGTTIANSVLAQGGYYERIGMANVGATNVATMTGNATVSGARVFILGDGQSTAVYGTSGNAFLNKSGANLLWANGIWYQYMYNGSAWVQLGT